MATEPIEESYFNWLCSNVKSIQDTNYWELLRILNRTEFVWLIPGDENRASEGLELREEFLGTTNTENDEDWFSAPCSVLEMLIAFSRRAAYQTDTEPKEWFWTFISNLKLDEYRRVSRSDASRIDDILYNFVWKLYSHDGHGGMFPMNQTFRDQTKLEIWYQFCEYLDDQGLLDYLL